MIPALFIDGLVLDRIMQLYLHFIAKKGIQHTKGVLSNGRITRAVTGEAHNNGRGILANTEEGAH